MNYFRIKKKKEITGVLQKGKRAYSGSVTVVYHFSKNVKMAVCVGKKYGKSVKRNYIKRLLRESFRCYAGKIKKPCAFLLIPKEAESYSFHTFKRDIENILKKEKLLED